MTKLKTLKDLKTELGHCEGCEGDIGTCDCECYNKKLRWEAIKWIKYLQESKKLPNHIKVHGVDILIKKNGIEEIIEWVKQFFNITEEDLKGDKIK
jgi:hypothetical protein